MHKCTHKHRPGYIIIPVVVIVMIQSDQQRLEIEQNKQKNNYNEVKIGENFSIFFLILESKQKNLLS